MSEEIKRIYGIDLGTTYSCIAYVDEYGRPVTLQNAEGERTTPSVVFFDGDNRVIGKEAKNNTMLYPDQIAELVKRQMGEENWLFFYDGQEYKAEEVSSYILKKLVSDAEMALGVSITDVVITCPAYFGINEREATAKAGEIAGLNVRSIINEPTAAAIAAADAFPEIAQSGQVLLVYDLGGGTFDITMIKVDPEAITVVATGGDHNLGGRNWDNILVNFLAEQWVHATGSAEDPLDDMETVQDLFGRAEDAKRSLSSRQVATVAVAHAGQRERVEISREKFDELTKNLLDRTIEFTRLMLAEAEKKGVTHFDQILLVGGSTRMPQVAERLQAEFGMEPRTFDPDEAVAKGAALYGQKLAIDEEIQIKIDSWSESGGAAVPREQIEEQVRQEVAERFGLPEATVARYNEMTVTNVTSRSFGVVAFNEVDEEVVYNLIRVNDQVPTFVTQTFGTRVDNQSSVELRLMENITSSEQATLGESEQIGEATLDLPQGLPAGAGIEITFSLNEQGRLQASAKELSENRLIETTVVTSRVISHEEVEEAKSRSIQLVIS